MDLPQIEQLIAERGIEVVKVGGADMDGIFCGNASSHPISWRAVGAAAFRSAT